MRRHSVFTSLFIHFIQISSCSFALLVWYEWHLYNNALMISNTSLLLSFRLHDFISSRLHISYSSSVASIVLLHWLTHYLILLKGMARIHVRFDYTTPVNNVIPCCSSRLSARFVLWWLLNGSLFDPHQGHGSYPNEICLHISYDIQYPMLFLTNVCSVESIGLCCNDCWTTRCLSLIGCIHRFVLTIVLLPFVVSPEHTVLLCCSRPNPLVVCLFDVCLFDWLGRAPSLVATTSASLRPPFPTIWLIIWATIF